MAAKVLQKPKIVQIIGSTIRVAHPDLSNEVPTFLFAPFAAAGTSLFVADNTNFQNGVFGIIGQIGDNQTEEFKVNAGPTIGQTLTILNTTAFDHEVNAPITRIQERAIKIYGANSVGGIGTIIASVNAIAAPIAHAVSIQWSKPYTEYTLLSTDTAYLYYYVTFYDGTSESVASAYVSADGYGSNAVSAMIQASLDATDTQLDNNKFTWEMMVRWLQLWQDAVTQFAYEDPPQSDHFIKKDWPFEIDDTSHYSPILMVQNQDRYDLSSLGLKYQNSNRAIIVIKIDDFQELNPLQVTSFKETQIGKHRAQVTVIANPGDVTLNVDNAASFLDSGSFNIGSQIITYTGKTLTSFTGIPATGDGSITGIINVGDPVWQNNAQGVPCQFTILQNILYLDRPPDALTAGKPLNINFYKKLPQLKEASDTTLITFTNTAEPFLNSKIEQRKGNADKSVLYMTDFVKQMMIEVQNDEIPTPQSYSYYDYEDPMDDFVERIYLSQ